MSTIGDWAGSIGSSVANAVKLAAAHIVTRVLGTFGLTLVSLNGLVPAMKEKLAEFAGALPPALQQFAGAIGLDVFMTMILSALAIKLAFKVLIVPKAAAAAITGGAA